MARRRRVKTEAATVVVLEDIAEPLRGLAVPVVDLVDDPRNANKHPPRSIAAIKASLTRYGQRKPIVVRREGSVVEAGGGTLVAARELGWSHLAVVFVDDDAQDALGYSLADNRAGEFSLWDDQELVAQLAEFEGDLADIGWLPGEAEALAMIVEATSGPDEESGMTEEAKLNGTDEAREASRLRRAQVLEFLLAVDEVDEVEQRLAKAGAAELGFGPALLRVCRGEA